MKDMVLSNGRPFLVSGSCGSVGGAAASALLPALLLLFCRQIVANNRTALHHELDGFEDTHVGSGITADSNQIGVAAGLQRADLVRPAEQVRGVDGGGLDGLDRLHAPFDHLGKLSGIVAVGIDAGVGGKGHFRAGLIGVAKVFTLEAADLLFLFDGLRQHSGLGAFLENEVVVVDVKDQISSVLLGEGDAFVVNQAGVLDRIDAGTDGVLDGLSAMRVGGDFAAELVGFLRNGLQLLESVLSCAGLITFAERAAGTADLDEVGAVLVGLADFGARGPGVVGDTFYLAVTFGGQE